VPENVFLISVDTLRKDYVGLYGKDPSPTPKIDAFFAGGTVYDRAVTPSPCTLPGVEQFLTGSLEPRAGQKKRLAEFLKAKGYDTHAIVSQHFFRGPGGAHGVFKRGYDGFDIQAQNARDQHNMTTRRATEISDAALKWLKQRQSAKKPFHLWLHYFDPHDPYNAPKAFRPQALLEALGDRRAVQCGGTRRQGGCERSGNTHGENLFDAAQVQRFRALYAAEISYVDHEIGRILSWLESSKVLRDTWVVFLSDHGERLGESGRWDHCQTLHAFELDVPLMVRRGTKPLDGHRRVGGAVSTLDIVPTLLSQLNIEGAGFDGVALTDSPDDRVITSVWRNTRARLNKDWKLRVEGRNVRLYDLQKDPTEQRNLAKTHPDRVKQLALEDSDSKSDRLARESEAIVEQLRAVGYIQ
jgi:arylsulfatase A-like enzyme